MTKFNVFAIIFANTHYLEAYMKKIFVLMLVSMIAVVSAFSQVFPNADKIAEDFWERGSYIKVIKDKKNIVYYGKANVYGFFIDEDDFNILGEFNALTFKPVPGDVAEFGMRKWDISSDENGNIIITSKKNK